MYISLADSCSKGFRKWADAHQPDHGNNPQVGGSAAGIIADPGDACCRHPSNPTARGSCPGQAGYDANGDQRILARRVARRAHRAMVRVRLNPLIPLPKYRQLRDLLRVQHRLNWQGQSRLVARQRMLARRASSAAARPRQLMHS
jgi:hypothetical protein